MSEMKRYFTDVLYELPKQHEPETSHIVYKAHEVDALQLRLAESEKAAYDVNGTIEHLKARLAEVMQDRDKWKETAHEWDREASAFRSMSNAQQTEIVDLEAQLASREATIKELRDGA